MIINCPKCGFSQPKDRYCANCGVDMEAFRPKTAPLTTRILKSWIFQSIILVVAIIVGLSFLKLQKQREAEDQTIAFTKPPPLPNNQAVESPPPPRVARAAPSRSQQLAAQNVAQTATQASATSSSNRGAIPPNASPSIPKQGPTRAAAPGEAHEFSQIDLVYAEIPRTVLANLEAGARPVDAEGLSAGIYPNIGPLMRQLSSTQRMRGLRQLDAAKGLAVHTNQPIITFKGIHDNTLNRNLGVTSQIIPMGVDENGLHLQIDVQRTARDTTAPSGIAELTFQSEITLSKGSGAFFAGLLPRRNLAPNERSFYSNASVFKVLTSADFQEDQSEFVLLIEAR